MSKYESEINQVHVHVFVMIYTSVVIFIQFDNILMCIVHDKEIEFNIE